jgi:hypothetical protein
VAVILASESILSGGAGALNFFLDKIFKDEYFETEKGSFSAESPKGRG